MFINFTILWISLGTATSLHAYQLEFDGLNCNLSMLHGQLKYIKWTIRTKPDIWGSMLHVPSTVSWHTTRTDRGVRWSEIGELIFALLQIFVASRDWSKNSPHRKTVWIQAAHNKSSLKCCQSSVKRIKYFVLDDKLLHLLDALSKKTTLHFALYDVADGHKHAVVRFVQDFRIFGDGQGEFELILRHSGCKFTRRRQLNCVIDKRNGLKKEKTY